MSILRFSEDFYENIFGDEMSEFDQERLMKMKIYQPYYLNNTTRNLFNDCGKFYSLNDILITNFMNKERASLVYFIVRKE